MKEKAMAWLSRMAEVSAGIIFNRYGHIGFIFKVLFDTGHNCCFSSQRYIENIAALRGLADFAAFLKFSQAMLD